jgi:hypothetical protein
MMGVRRARMGAQDGESVAERENLMRGRTSWLPAGLLAAGVFGLAGLIGITLWRTLVPAVAPIYAAMPAFFADSSGDDDNPEVPPAQVDKYVAVYKAMQRDHGLTVEEAASKQGMTLAAFRSIEDKIERDDVLRERVRKALRPAPEESPSPSAGKQKK